jgi:hypothetical protein
MADEAITNVLLVLSALGGKVIAGELLQGGESEYLSLEEGYVHVAMACAAVIVIRRDR